MTLGPSTAGILFLYSIICTLGIGAVFWAALAFIVGWLMTTLVAAVRGEHAPTQPTSSPQSDALTAYVRRALQAGANDDQLLRRLERQGWTEDEIIQAIQRVQEIPDAPNASGAA
ncbi:hypothetical protein GFS31_06760 [Leptolyngbya sp. BL0902]|uniref:hypothetical protein n=1 Tax=Leptolyngbya sp. BL0902 TaxID=1115757 RepID=UPI0018E6FEF8|nr:hypothetical protein [Leptolyngbya sp. BL0902]QQE64004.1 hypothetical protein GFS31_06760 [Leptolyngbya sp. BL0902]